MPMCVIIVIVRIVAVKTDNSNQKHREEIIMYKKVIAAAAALAISFGAVGLPAVESGLSIGVKSISASAETLTYGDFEYTVLDDGTVEITKYNGYIVDDTYGFEYDGELLDITIPSEINGKTVTSIGDNAFFNCVNVKSVVIPNTVTKIGEYAFCQAFALANINIPDSVTYIGSGAFSDTAITEIAIPESVTYIGSLAFNSTNITSINLPSGIKTIKFATFFNCSSLTSITIPNGVETIGVEAFEGCSELTDITLPSTVSSIGNNAFSYCNSLENITVDGDNGYYTSVDGVLFDNNMTELVAYPIGNTRTSYTIPDGVTIIDAYSFFDCYYIANLTMPDTVEYVGDEAFLNCSNLKEVTMSNSLKRIDAFSFAYCEKLTNITIPDSVTFIGVYAFSKCGFTSITIPSSVTSIGDYAIGYNIEDKIDDFQITCYVGTEGETYAKENGFDYEAIYDQMTHPHNFVLVSESATTCTSIGKRTYECECGVISTTTYIKGHTKVTDKAVAATCTTDGKTEGSHCSVCGEVITAQTTVKATGHKYTVTKTVKPTVKAQGYTLNKCSVCGKTTKTNYTAKLIAMSKTKVSGVKSTYAYTGKAIAPTVTVKYGSTKLVKGTDYTVSYKNNKKTGKATITVKGKGKYSGTVTKTFIIVPKKATVTSAKSAKTKTVTVKWKKDTQASGYQLVYSTNSKFKSSKTVNIAKNSTVSKTLTKLTKGKTYYIKVRSYKTISGKKYYGAYSAVKSVKCK
jgi:hypothetical protein